MERRKDNKNRVLKEGEHQRANGTYEYKWRDGRGKRHSVYAKTLDELREKEIDVLRDVLDGIRADKNDITINDLFFRWIQLKKGIKENTFQGYKWSYRQYVEPDFGRTHIVDLKRSDVRAFYNKLSDTRNLRYSSIDTVHTVLHQVLELGVEDEYLRYNPADGALKELKRAHGDDRRKRKALTVPEQKRFEEYLLTPRCHRWYPIFTILLYTGMRVGEVTGLRWEDIHLDEGTISVNHTLVYFDRGGSERCGFAINTTKTRAGERIIPMLPKVREAFLMEREYLNEAEMTCEVVIDGYTDFIFLNRFGNVMNNSTMNRALDRIIRDCNYDAMEKMEMDRGADVVLLPHFSNHTLRHTFTTRMCEANVNIKAIQDILGHADAETTLQIYADATKEMKSAEMLDFQEYFDKMKLAQTGTD